MATVICNMEKCKHRSKRAMRAISFKDGRKCYGCTLKRIVVSEIFDIDGDIEATAGEENMASCSHYEPIKL